MRTIKKLGAFLLSLCLLISCATGCGKNEEKKNFTLRIMTIFGDEDKKAVYSNALSEFSKEESLIYIRDTSALEADALRLGAGLASTYASTDAPHIVYYYSSSLDMLEGCFVSIDEIRKYYPDYASQVSETAIKALAKGDICYGVPIIGQWQGLLYNKELFTRFGLEAPDTWQKLMTASGVFIDNGVIPFANSADEAELPLEALCYAFGGVSALGEGLTPDDEASYRAWSSAFREYKALCDEGVFPAPVLTGETAQYLSQSDIAVDTAHESAALLFNSEKAAMIFINSEQLSDIENQDRCGLAAIPTPDGAVNESITGDYEAGIYITAKAFNNLDIRDTVVKLAEYLISEEIQSGFAALGYLPSTELEAEREGLSADILALYSGGERLSDSSITAENSSRWSRAKELAAQLYYNIITPEQAAELFADSTLELETLLAPVVSESDVSNSDVG